MLPDAGAFGFRPGTFRAAFPGYQSTYDFGGREVPEFWKSYSWLQAHNDYLQTIIEWGYLGALMWAVLFYGALWRAGVILRKSLVAPGRDGALLMAGCIILALAGTLLQAFVDFPLQIPSIQLYVAVLLGICWSGATSQSPASARHRSSPRPKQLNQ